LAKNAEETIFFLLFAKSMQKLALKKQNETAQGDALC